MSNLISGQEALIALANGESVQGTINGICWGDARLYNVLDFFKDGMKFRLKPKTIMLNGIEVPAPFEPKEGDTYWVVDIGDSCGYSYAVLGNSNDDKVWLQFGAWRTEDEIKRVVQALRSIFKGVK